MIETIGVDAVAREGLFQTDVGVVRLRRLLRSIAQEQAKALSSAAAAAPASATAATA
jgi:hypothetical protein